MEEVGDYVFMNLFIKKKYTKVVTEYERMCRHS